MKIRTFFFYCELNLYFITSPNAILLTVFVILKCLHMFCRKCFQSPISLVISWGSFSFCGNSCSLLSGTVCHYLKPLVLLFWISVTTTDPSINGDLKNILATTVANPHLGHGTQFWSHNSRKSLSVGTQHEFSLFPTDKPFLSRDTLVLDFGHSWVSIHCNHSVDIYPSMY